MKFIMLESERNLFIWFIQTQNLKKRETIFREMKYSSDNDYINDTEDSERVTYIC